MGSGPEAGGDPWALLTCPWRLFRKQSGKRGSGGRGGTVRAWRERPAAKAHHRACLWNATTLHKQAHHSGPTMGHRGTADGRGQESMKPRPPWCVVSGAPGARRNDGWLAGPAAGAEAGPEQTSAGWASTSLLLGQLALPRHAATGQCLLRGPAALPPAEH